MFPRNNEKIKQSYKENKLNTKTITRYNIKQKKTIDSKCPSINKKAHSSSVKSKVGIKIHRVEDHMYHSNSYTGVGKNVKNFSYGLHIVLSV